jgi:hypothetical protein
LNREIVDPVREEFGDLLALPLRSHMPGAVNSGEIETIIANEVA